MRAVPTLLLALASGAALAAQQPAADPQLPRPSFDARAELVLVDVTVVDRNGTPIPNLKDSDFELQVNGQPRPISALQFVSTVATDAPAPPPREADATSNQATTTGRLLLFVVDESNLRAGSTRSVLRAAQTMMDRLAPGDLVGLARLPYGQGNVEFTADRARIVDALGKVSGQASVRTGMSKVRISEAYALDTNDTITWEGAVDRECASESGPGREACATAVEGDARQLLNDTSSRTQMTVRSLETLVARLVPLKTPINLVLISEGLFVARDRQDMTGLARRAAEARATIHVVRPNQSFFDVEENTPSNSGNMSRFYDDGLLSEGLEQLAGSTRGSMSTIGASATAVFDRLGRELSGYYLLGFEPTDADRTGKERRIKVQVKPRGLTVRARPTFVINGSASPGETSAASPAATASPMDAMKEALVAPLPARSLPLKVATYTATDAASSQVRIVISAEVGEPATDEVEWPVGILILDKNEKAVVSKVAPMKLAPASATSASPRMLMTAALLEPGEYTLRLAVSDDTGRTGSVHHTIDAHLASLPGKINVSDLLVVSQPKAGDTPLIRPSAVVDTDTLTAMLEMTSADKTLVGRTKVTMQVADSDEGPALVTVPAQPASRGEGQRAFAATLRLGVLPPGEYEARAIVSVPGQPDQRLVRRFLLSPPKAAALDPSVDLTAPLDPDAPPAPIAAAKIIAPVPAFAPQTVMAPEVLAPFLDGLADQHPLSAPVQAALDRAREGRFDAGDLKGESEDDQVAITFIKGLAAFQKGEFAEAQAWFQQTLKAGSDFLGAAFYLGACHAVGNRDKDAIGAWQMALLSDNPGAVYPALVDALLRVGDSRQAMDVLAEAPDAWPNDDERLRREALAESMLGDFEAALPKLVDLLNQQKGDQNLLFVGIQVLYRLQAQGTPLTPSQKALFADWVKRHQAMGGPNVPLVETWRKYVLR